MGRTFVYNSGERVPLSHVLEKSFGLFFDGTANNLRNTEIRKKYLQIEEYEDEKPSSSERKVYRKKALTWLWKNEKNNSYKNDFSNVARIKLCCSREYAIYVEGIGTEDEKSDTVLPGQAFGTGKTGIREKVKKGCDSLAIKINNLILSNIKFEKLECVSLTIDVFGFSRGAAAARNFIYEITKPEMDWIQHASSGYGVVLPADSFGDHVLEAHLIDNKLPPHGRLGLALVRLGVSKEVVKNMDICIRFAGLFDTVASYGVFNHEKNAEKLFLHELGQVRQVVHFTAMDEHRDKFGLTPTQCGIIKRFPGVHSDIGGGYDNDEEIVITIEANGSRTAINKDYKFHQFIDQQEKEGWFMPGELYLKPNAAGFLSAKRSYVRKEYSYIILHYMEDYAREFLINKEFVLSTKEKYLLGECPILWNTDRILSAYVEGRRGEWKLRLVNRNSGLMTQSNTNEEIHEQDIPNDSSAEVFKTIELDELHIIGDNTCLRRLRNKYCHWSSDYGKIGMKPAENRVRKIINDPDNIEH